MRKELDQHHIIAHTTFQRKEYEEINQTDSYFLDVRHIGRVFVIGTIFILHLHSNDGASMLILEWHHPGHQVIKIKVHCFREALVSCSQPHARVLE